MKTLSILLLALALSGCYTGTRDDGPPSDPRVYVDSATHCEYLSTDHFHGSALTPRIASDGLTHRGCRTEGRVSP